VQGSRFFAHLSPSRGVRSLQELPEEGGEPDRIKPRTGEWSEVKEEMGKKNKQNPQIKKESAIPAAVNPLFSKNGLKIFAGGIVVGIFGYVLLSFTDSAGQNLPSTLSPFLILGGYALIGISLIIKDPAPQS
jgi:hypothetical protein